MSVARDSLQLPDAVRAEAAAWIARMHGPRRSEEMEAGLRRWLAEDVRHAQAFERMTEAWEVATSVSTGKFPRLPEVERARTRTNMLARAATVLVVCGVAALGAYMWLSDQTFATAVGEQRSVRLDDGSRVLLNSDTRITIDIDGSRRLVRLAPGGEAYFDVVADPSRPFLVDAGAREIAVLGTSFSVRHEPETLAVILVEGKVSVAADAVTLLAPGQRLRINSKGAPVLDTPVLDSVLAWRRGEIVFDRTTLVDALAEMNRYDQTKLVLAREPLGRLLISGGYRIGDNEGFTRALAAMYDIKAVRRGDRIQLQ